MALYHSHIQVISRSSGRSSVAAAAYRSGERIPDKRTGLVHDYTSKNGVSYSEIVLPSNAPERWKNRACLWNDVEASEKPSTAQLAREINYALPRELSFPDQVILARKYAQSFADEGMVVDFSIHDTNGNNPHVHMMLTMRPCDHAGFTAKSENLYHARDDKGNNLNVNATEFKSLDDRWAKVYEYKNGETLTQAEAYGLGLNPTKDRKRKQPIQTTRYFTDWNSPEKAAEWRERLANMQNQCLGEAGFDCRVDHRSYKEQGVDQIPTKHEGVTVCKVEKQEQAKALHMGYDYQPITDRRRENQFIKSLNERFKTMFVKLVRSFSDIQKPVCSIKLHTPSIARKPVYRKSSSTRKARGNNGLSR